MIGCYKPGLVGYKTCGIPSHNSKSSKKTMSIINESSCANPEIEDKLVLNDVVPESPLRKTEEEEVPETQSSNPESSLCKTEEEEVSETQSSEQADKEENEEILHVNKQDESESDDSTVIDEEETPLSILQDAATGPCDIANTIIASVIKSGLFGCVSGPSSSPSSDGHLKRARSDSVVECGNKSARMESL